MRSSSRIDFFRRRNAPEPTGWTEKIPDLESAANIKLTAILSPAVAAATYAYHGAIHFPLALAMFAGSCIGSYAGAQYSDRIGNVWIKRLFIGAILMMMIKLLMDA